MIMVIEWILEHFDAVIAGFSALGLLTFNIVSFIKNRKKLKNAKTDEERAAALEGMKLRAFGLISASEELFKGISKSGSSKLLYVLGNLKDVAGTYGLEFDEEFWTDFINTAVEVCNNVADDKAYEQMVPIIIEQIKKEIPSYVKDANDLFTVIPNSEAAKMEYILHLIRGSCSKSSIDVYELYDWRTYVQEYINSAA